MSRENYSPSLLLNDLSTSWSTVFHPILAHSVSRLFHELFHVFSNQSGSRACLPPVLTRWYSPICGPQTASSVRTCPGLTLHHKYSPRVPLQRDKALGEQGCLTAPRSSSSLFDELLAFHLKCVVVASYRQGMRFAVRSTSFFMELKFIAFALGQNLLVLRLYST